MSAILFSDALDEHAAAEEVESRQELLVHYQQPRISGSDVFMEHKGGQYIPCSPAGSGNPGCGPQVWQWQSWSDCAHIIGTPTIN